MRLILDIETIALPIDPELLADKEAELREEYVQERTIEKHLAKWKSKYGLDIGCSEIVCIGMKEVDGAAAALYGPSEKDLVKDLFDMLELSGVSNTIIGFNIKKFDLRNIMRVAYQAGLGLDMKLHRQHIIDLQEWCQWYGMSGSLASIAKKLGLPQKAGKGSEVEGLYALDKLDRGTRVADYCKQDLVVEEALYKYFFGMLGL